MYANNKTSDKEEKISINLTEAEYDKLEGLLKELDMRGIKYKYNADVLRIIIKSALENRERLDFYLEKKQAAKDYFHPEEDGFNSEAFAGTFIDRAKGKLRTNLLLNAGSCRIYISRDNGARIDRHNGGIVILDVKGTKRKSRAGDCSVSFGLGSIKQAQIYNTESGERQEYRYLPAERMPAQKVLELVLE
jgi:hypothetical protein